MVKKDGPRVLVTDFDGTMTRHDFYLLAIERVIPASCPNYWTDYRQGRMTHFEALQAYFQSIEASEEEVVSMVNDMEIDPQLPKSVAALAQAGWKVVITSAGCDWYINYLLDSAGVSLEVYANPGVFIPGNGLQMSLPASDRFLSPTIGVDKAGVVSHWLEKGYSVAFAGDGFPDAEAARLVDTSLRFARGDLAKQLQRDGLEFRKFDVWSDIADQLLRNI